MPPTADRPAERRVRGHLAVSADSAAVHTRHGCDAIAKVALTRENQACNVIWNFKPGPAPSIRGTWAGIRRIAHSPEP